MATTGESEQSGEMTRQREQARTFAIEAARSLRDNQCSDALVLNLRGLSPVAEYLVIASGTSDRQMKSAADDVAELAPTTEHALVRQSSDSRSTWIVCDFGDVVVHIFEPRTRAYYDLELLWGDAERVRWQREG